MNDSQPYLHCLFPETDEIAIDVFYSDGHHAYFKDRHHRRRSDYNAPLDGLLTNFKMYRPFIMYLFVKGTFYFYDASLRDGHVTLPGKKTLFTHIFLT